MSTSTLIVLAVIVVLAVWVISIYNGLVSHAATGRQPVLCGRGS